LILQFVSAQKEIAYAQKGFVDLSTYDLEEQIVKLDGQWEFYWRKLLEPHQFETIPTKYGEVPVFWKNYEESYSRFGYATYRLKFLLSKDQLQDVLALRLNNVHNSYKLWFNGELLCQNGVVGEDYESSVPKWVPRVLSLPKLLIENEIVIQVSNYRHRNGGIQDPIEIGNYDSIATNSRHQFSSELFLAGGCFVLFWGVFL
jgi:hypothetical protein